VKPKLLLDGSDDYWVLGDAGHSRRQAARLSLDANRLGQVAKAEELAKKFEA
jgi:hypothetical protein